MCERSSVGVGPVLCAALVPLLKAGRESTVVSLKAITFGNELITFSKLAGTFE